MKVEDTLRLNMLFDAYGKLLSKGQNEIMKCYLFDNFTVSEIAENLNVSRQSVKDSITKAQKKLEFYEAQIGYVAKVEALSKEIKKLKNKILKGN